MLWNDRPRSRVHTTKHGLEMPKISGSPIRKRNGNSCSCGLRQCAHHWANGASGQSSTLLSMCARHPQMCDCVVIELTCSIVDLLITSRRSWWLLLPSPFIVARISHHAQVTTETGVRERYVARFMTWAVFLTWATDQGGMTDKEAAEEWAMMERTPNWPSNFNGPGLWFLGGLRWHCVYFEFRSRDPVDQVVLCATCLGFMSAEVARRPSSSWCTCTTRWRASMIASSPMNCS